MLNQGFDARSQGIATLNRRRAGFSRTLWIGISLPKAAQSQVMLCSLVARCSGDLREGCGRSEPYQT
jgi:hypothetical protein